MIRKLLAITAFCLASISISIPARAAKDTKTVYPFKFAPSEGLVNRTEAAFRQEICLNGYWDFQPLALPESFRYGKGSAPELPSPDKGTWSDVRIKIPSPWNANSFSRERLVGPDHRAFPSYPEEWNDVRMGWLRKKASIPSDWSGKRILLHFEAVAGHAIVLVDGKKVCENFDNFLPFEADITDAVTPGKEIEILVGVRSQWLFEDNSTVGRRIIPAGSMWGSHINGIWQDVFLLAEPKTGIEDVYVKPLVSKGLLEFDVTLRNFSSEKADMTLDGDVMEWINLAGNSVNEAPVPAWDLGKKALKVKSDKITLAPGETKTITLSVPVAKDALKFWTPAHPNLYALVLKASSGKNGIDARYTRFGWREWTLSGTKQCLNGEPFELNGDSWHFMGIPQMTRRYAWAWFSAIKGMNGNAVRPHAQVYPRFYLDVADEMGICVLDETANWGSDGGPKFDSPAFWENSKDHLRRLVLRDRNHASIFGWSISNENKPVIINVDRRPDLMPLQEQAWVDWRDIVRENDSTRPWISSDGEDDGNGILPVTVGHYGDENSMRRWIAIGKPWGIGEHGMAYYGTPEQVSKYNGERAYESQQGRMEGLAKEAWQLISSQRENGASYSTVFNMAWYALKPLPLGMKDLTKQPEVGRDGIFFSEFVEGVPGVQPERLGPYTTTFNPGYDPSLPVYDPWPMYEAMRAVNAPGGPAWCEYADIDKADYAPLPPVEPVPYAEVVFIGAPDGKAKSILDMQKVVFSKKMTKSSNSLYIIDGSRRLSPADLKDVAKNAAKGADIWIWGLTPEGLPSLKELLPASVELDNLRRSSFLPVQLSWTRGLANSDFYFCELQNSDAARYTIKGDLVDNGTVLLDACRTDWRMWNRRPENVKTGSVLRSERECTQATPVLVQYHNGNSDIFISTLTDFANSEKGFNTLSALLAHAGIACGARETAADEVFFVRDGQMPIPSGAARYLRRLDGGRFEADIWVYSPRPLDDLLIEPDMPKLHFAVGGENSRLFLNGKELEKARSNRNETIFESLPLKQGWNKLTVNAIGGARRSQGSFRSPGHEDFLYSLKCRFTPPGDN